MIFLTLHCIISWRGSVSQYRILISLFLFALYAVTHPLVSTLDALRKLFHEYLSYIRVRILSLRHEMTPVEITSRIGGKNPFLQPSVGGIAFLQNVGIKPPHNTAQ